MNNKGRVGHTNNDPFKIVVCRITEKMRKAHKQQWPEVFNNLTSGMDNRKEIRSAVWERLK